MVWIVVDDAEDIELIGGGDDDEGRECFGGKRVGERKQEMDGREDEGALLYLRDPMRHASAFSDHPSARRRRVVS